MNNNNLFSEISSANYSSLKYFKASEFSFPELMCPKFLTKLDHFREFLGSRLIITSSNSGLHCQNSYHYQNIAVDVMAPDITSLIDFWIAAEKFNFSGIGLYPDWKYIGNIHGGLHIDDRPIINHGARWMCKINEKFEKKYFKLSHDNLSELYLI